jgi:hypothetical protein
MDNRGQACLIFGLKSVEEPLSCEDGDCCSGHGGHNAQEADPVLREVLPPHGGLAQVSHHDGAVGPHHTLRRTKNVILVPFV